MNKDEHPAPANELNGWLVIDKPLNMTSAQVVGRLKHLFHPKKIGHAGTLDPLASGLLPIAFGKATRTISFVMDGEKTYRFEVTFGKATTTDDAEGEVVKTSPVRPTKEEIEAVLGLFIGKIKQTPPVYSALKIKGKRAYQLAREGKEVQLQPREVFIKSLKLLEMPNSDCAVFEVICGKGTYVRSLGRDISEKLGTCGYISSLRRTACGKFIEKNAILLEKLEKIAYSSNPEKFLIPIETVLSDILELAVSRKEALALSQGQPLKITDLKECPPLKDGFYQATFEGQLIAFVVVGAAFVRPTKVFKQNF